MDEDMESRKRDSNGKPIRKRSHTRRTTQQDSSINIAQARREIVNALHLHRSSLSLSSSSSSFCDYGVGGGKSSSTNGGGGGGGGGSQYCSSLLECLPLPQPTWSTTAPSILATPPPPPPPPAVEALEFEWAENLASSYTWWLGFLKTLDGDNNSTTQVVSKYPFEEKEEDIMMMGMGHYMGFGQCPHQYGSQLGDPPPCLDGNDHQSPCLDEWLTIPTVDDQGEI